MLRERLRVDLPAAMLTPADTVLSRKYELKICANTKTRIVRAQLDGIVYSPPHALIEIVNQTPGIAYGVYSGDGGTVPLGLEWDDFAPMDICLFNLSYTTPVSITFMFRGWQEGE